MTVDCEQDFAYTLVFARADTKATEIAETVRRALSRMKTYKNVHVSIDSFLEHVEESQREQLARDLRSAFSIQSP